MRIIYPLFFLFISYSLLAQKLPQAIHQLSDKDTSKVSKILKLAYDLQYKKPKKSLKYAQNALKLAQKQEYTIGKLNAQIQFINSAFETRQFVEAQTIAKMGLKKAKQMKNPHYISMFYYKLAESFQKQKKEQKGINIYIEAVEYLDKMGESAEIAKMRHLNRIGSTTQPNDMHSDIQYWKESINIAKKHHIQNIEMAWAYNRIAAKYQQFLLPIEDRHKYKDKIHQKIPYLDSSLHIAEQLLTKNPENRAALMLKANSFVEKAAFYSEMLQEKLGLEYAKKGAKIRFEIGEREAIRNAYYNLSRAYEGVLEIDSAIYYMHKVLKMSVPKEKPYEISHYLADFYYQKEDYKNASTFYKRAAEGHQKSNIIETEKIAHDLHLKYQDEKKEAQIKAQKAELKQQEAQNLLLIIGISFVLIFALYLFYTNRQRQKKNKILASQKEEIKLQAEELQLQSEELKTVNETLVTLDNFKEQMTGMMVHDLKNPLNSVIALSENENLAQKEHQIIHQSGQQMLTMVSNMLDVYKFEESEIQLDLEKTSLSEIIHLALSEVGFLAKQKSLTILNEIQAEYLLHIDIELIKRVFVNIFTNAIKYSSNNSKIWLKVEDIENQTIKIFIQDEGIGIPKAQQAKIFEKFSQVEARQLGKTRSTGLGLTFCKMVVEAHNGQIGVMSEEDTGTSFWFSLKILQKNEKVNNKLPNTENETLSDVSFGFDVSEEEYLKIYLQELQQLDLYEASKIMHILENIRKQAPKNVQKWVNELENTVFTYNEDMYKRLINI